MTASVVGGELVLAQRRFSFAPDDAGATIWVVPRARDASASTTTPRRPRSCSNRTRYESRSAQPTRSWSSTPGALASSASPTTTRCEARLDAGALARLTTLERYSLVDDAWAAVVAGRLTAAEFLAAEG
ncbi:MAG: hypothetical protein R2705_03085 [Ilumatobacteraceae bacterium]